MEPYIDPSSYVKHNNNYGFVLPNARNTPQVCSTPSTVPPAVPGPTYRLSSIHRISIPPTVQGVSQVWLTKPFASTATPKRNVAQQLSRNQSRVYATHKYKSSISGMNGMVPGSPVCAGVQPLLVGAHAAQDDGGGHPGRGGRLHRPADPHRRRAGVCLCHGGWVPVHPCPTEINR